MTKSKLTLSFAALLLASAPVAVHAETAIEIIDNDEKDKFRFLGAEGGILLRSRQSEADGRGGNKRKNFLEHRL